MWILIRWLNQKSTDLDVQCFQETRKLGFSRTRAKKEDNLSLAWFYHTSAPAELMKDKATTTVMERGTHFKKGNLQNDTILV